MKDYSVIDCTESVLAYPPATLRDQFAMAAMQVMLASDIECGPEQVQIIVASAYVLADAMLASDIECGPEQVQIIVASAYVLADAMLEARKK